MSQRPQVIQLYKTYLNNIHLETPSFLILKILGVEAKLIHLLYFNTDWLRQLLFLGREYPQGFDFFRTRLKRAFMKNQDVQDPEKIKTMLKHGEYVIKELEALYMLRKYRTLKRRYYNEPIPMEIKTEVESKN